MKKLTFIFSVCIFISACSSSPQKQYEIPTDSVNIALDKKCKGYAKLCKQDEGRICSDYWVSTVEQLCKNKADVKTLRMLKKWFKTQDLKIVKKHG